VIDDYPALLSEGIIPRKRDAKMSLGNPVLMAAGFPPARE